MTVVELIERLRELPQDMPVVVKGYEGGYDDPNIVRTGMTPDRNWQDGKKPNCYFGRHGTLFQSNELDDIVACVLIDREE